MSVWAIAGAGPGRGDGVGDFAWLLACYLARERPVTLILPQGQAPLDPEGAGDQVSVEEVPSGWGPASARAVLALLAGGGPVLVHFVPQLYGWYGAKPVFAWLLTRLREAGCRLITVAHEFSVPIGRRPSRSALAIAHRALLAFVVRASERVVLTTAFAEQLFHRRYPAQAATFRRIPVSATVPVLPLDSERRRRLRAELASGEDGLVAGLFASGLAGQAERVGQVLGWCHEKGVAVQLLVFGKAAASFCQHPALASHRPRLLPLGWLSGRGLSACLGCADLHLAFYPDGASTRRTSLMAALAHGLPVVTNEGPLTDPDLRACPGLCFVDEWGATDAPLPPMVQSADLRRQRGEAGRAWYAAHCGWDRVGAAYSQLLDELS